MGEQGAGGRGLDDRGGGREKEAGGGGSLGVKGRNVCGRREKRDDRYAGISKMAGNERNQKKCLTTLEMKITDKREILRRGEET